MEVQIRFSIFTASATNNSVQRHTDSLFSSMEINVTVVGDMKVITTLFNLTKHYYNITLYLYNILLHLFLKHTN